MKLYSCEILYFSVICLTFSFSFHSFLLSQQHPIVPHHLQAFLFCLYTLSCHLFSVSIFYEGYLTNSNN